MHLHWKKYISFISARNDFKNKSCVYVQTDNKGVPVRVGKASKGLQVRYRGGTGYAIEAAMHQSGNLFFVAAVPESQCEKVEANLIYNNKDLLTYNNIGKNNPPSRKLTIVHSGDRPKFKA